MKTRCTKCNKLKGAHLFSKGNGWCKLCLKKWRVHYLASMRLTDFNKWKAAQLRSNWNRRAKLLNIDISYVPMPNEIRAWLDSQHPYKCYYTNVELERDYAVDHKVPLARGGTFAITNLCITQPHINSAKGTLSDKEFKQLLKLIEKWEDKGALLLKRLQVSNTIFRK